MKPAGKQRLQRLLKRLQEQNTETARQNWVQAIFDKTKIQENPQELKQYQVQQLKHLEIVWAFSIQLVETAIQNNQVLHLIQNIIRYLYLPDTLDNFFSEDTSVQWALLTLHPNLQLHLRSELIAALDELLIGCDSADNFLESKQDPNMYKVLDGIIKNINKYAIQRNRVPSVSGSTPQSLGQHSSFSSLVELNLWQLTYLSSLASEENRILTPSSSNVVVTIPQIEMADSDLGKLFPSSGLYLEPEWMRDGLSLSNNLLEELKKHQNALYAKFSENDAPASGKVEQKLAFLDLIIHAAEHQQLTPALFFKVSQDKPLLFSAFLKSHVHKLWQDLCNELKNALWEKAISHNANAWGYRIPDESLTRSLKEKHQKLHPKTDMVDFKTLPLGSTARLYQEKVAALNYLLDKNNDGILCAADFIYIRKNFPYYTAKRLIKVGRSATETLINQAQNSVMELLWIDAGGEGIDRQQSLRKEQKNNACIPNYRRLSWAGKTI